MTRRFPVVFFSIFAGLLQLSSANARNLFPQNSNALTSIAVGSPTLAPFQHVRFCLRYPSDCKSEASESERIELNAGALELLNRVNHGVNAAIIPRSKAYGSNLEDGWAIAPEVGDCNDYAVTKRHELLENGLPSKALRLSVVKTTSGVGHLVLVIITTKGDVVMDNLTEMIRPWQSTGYQWLKIQSAADSKFWYEVKAPVRESPSVSLADQKIRLADR
jgi:predicted transglutaminase-like cysteine proteinase